MKVVTKEWKEFLHDRMTQPVLHHHTQTLEEEEEEEEEEREGEGGGGEEERRRKKSGSGQDCLLNLYSIARKIGRN